MKLRPETCAEAADMAVALKDYLTDTLARMGALNPGSTCTGQYYEVRRELLNALATFIKAERNL